MEKSVKGTDMLGLLLYVCMSAAGLTMIKIGTSKESTLLLDSAGFNLKLSWILVIGLCVYVLSFLLSIMVMKRMNLTIFYPVSAGLIYILVSLSGFLILKEAITIQQLIGMAIILSGIIVMNLGRS